MEPVTSKFTSSQRDAERVLNTLEAATFCGLRPKTLESMRLSLRGPKFVRLSRRAIRYRISDLREWLDRQTVPTQGDARAPRLGRQR
jgi:predicted DNA-binding transcriptional regulator AlpA